MKPTQTGIAVALALTVVIIIFILPELSPFGRPQTQTAAATQSQTLQTAPQTQPAPTTMPAETTPITQLITKDEVVGTGVTATAGDVVTVNYIGSLTNGTVFDASANHPETVNGFTFDLGAGQVIKGWDQGIVGMKEGGKRKLLIPASLAYGSRSVGDGLIPADSALVFEVELLKVQKPAQ